MTSGKKVGGQQTKTKFQKKMIFGQILIGVGEKISSESITS